MTKKILAALSLVLPISLLAQKPAKQDTLQGGFLETVTISYHKINTDYHNRYDGQARTERLLDYIPGVNLISRGNFAQEPVLHGMSDGQINVTINSMRVFGACTDRMDPATSYAEPNNMKSVQVCFGPSFGNCGAAIGGGMNFDLRQAEAGASKKWSGSVGTGFETNAAARQLLGNIQYSSKRFAFSLDGIYRKADDYSPGGNKNENIAKYGQWTAQNGFSLDDKGRIIFSQYEKWNAHANTTYKLNAHQTISADYLQDEANNVGYPALVMDVLYAKLKMASLTHEYSNIEKALYYWQSKIYFNDINHAMDNSKRPMDEIPMQMDMGMIGHSQTGGAYTQAYWKASTNQVIKTKVETYVNRWSANMTMMPMAMSTDSMSSAMSMLTIPDAQRSVVGLDATDEISLQNFWFVTPGIHTEYNRSSIFSAQGKATLATMYASNPNNTNWLYNAFVEAGYHPASHFGFGLKLAKAMRAPTLKEMYANYLYNRVDGYDYIGNPAIKTESSFNIELNIYYKQKSFDIAVKGFSYFINNYIAGFVQPGDSSMTPGAVGVKQYGNVRSAYIAGTSLLFTWRLSPRLTFNSNTTWQQGEDNNKNYLPLMTPLKSVNNLRYAINSWQVFIESVSATSRYKTSAFYGETPTQGFSIANAGVDKSININGKQIILSFTGNNVFNKFYTESIDVIKLPREGRNFIIHATYNW